MRSTNNIARCRTGDTTACRAVLASPLLTDGSAQNSKPPPLCPPRSPSPVYLLFPFQCVIENGKPTFKTSPEPYYHEALDYRLAIILCGVLAR